MIFLMFLIYYGYLCQFIGGTIAGILYPRESESREVKSLDGIWDFMISPTNDPLEGFENWYLKNLSVLHSAIPMPVPASYNDITVDKDIRDNVGLVWYLRHFFVPQSWNNQKVWLRFGSVCYSATVWVNNYIVLSHKIGHLPFQQDITRFLIYGKKNSILVAVDNQLTNITIPQGSITTIQLPNKQILYQSYSFDFFNYAGIDRPVLLYTTPQLYIDDVTVSTDVSNGTGLVYFKVEYKRDSDFDEYESDTVNCNVVLLDKSGNEVDAVENCTGKLTVPSARLWWPYLMDPEPGYLYELKVEITGSDNNVTNTPEQKDVYRLPVGIRKITWTNTSVLINDKPIYIRGVGKHEDFFVKGKGLDLSVMLRDYELLKWLGVNTFRTSHYPYSEEMMDLADSMGIMVIDECPSVDTDLFSNVLLENHKRSLTELFQRDKNRPSVIMWSVANEPRSHLKTADAYFRNIVNHIKALDSTRPITMAISRAVSEDKAGQYLDVLAFNRYNAWYSFTGVTETITQNVVREAEKWFTKLRKPVLMTEYGADTYPGIHEMPERAWSEEFQMILMEEHFKAFDILRNKGFFIGEMIWNFADFQTAQTYRRVDGNKKGIFTKERQPKTSAFLLRKRYHELAHELDRAPLPKDLSRYTTNVMFSNTVNNFTDNDC